MKNIISLGLAATLTLSSAVIVGTVGCAGTDTHRSTGTYIDDTAVDAKVKADLIADHYVKADEIVVRTYQGKVQLSGFVDSQLEKQRAAEIAREVNGVRWVKNDILVKSKAAAAAGQPVQEPSGSQK